MTTETAETTEIPLRMLDYFQGNLNGNEFKMVMLIWRWTKGAGSATVNISIEDITAMTKVGKTAVARAMKNLVDSKLILITKMGGGRPNSYELNHEAGLTWNSYDQDAIRINGIWVDHYSQNDR